MADQEQGEQPDNEDAESESPGSGLYRGLMGASISSQPDTLGSAASEMLRRMSPGGATAAPEDEYATAPVHDYLASREGITGLPARMLASIVPSTKGELPATVANAILALTGAAGKPYVNEAGNVAEKVFQFGSPQSRWVMRSANKPIAYALSGKWLGTPKALGGNQFAPYASGRALEMAPSELASPPGWEAIKAILGQAVKQ